MPVHKTCIFIWFCMRIKVLRIIVGDGETVPWVQQHLKNIRQNIRSW